MSLFEESSPRVSHMEMGRKVQRERGRHGFAASDTFSFDGYLAEVISGGVRMLRERNCGRPAMLTNEEWVAILDEIVAGFESYMEHDERTPEFERGMQLLDQWWGALWD